MYVCGCLQAWRNHLIGRNVTPVDNDATFDTAKTGCLGLFVLKIPSNYECAFYNETAWVLHQMGMVEEGSQDGPIMPRSFLREFTTLVPAFEGGGQEVLNHTHTQRGRGRGRGGGRGGERGGRVMCVCVCVCVRMLVSLRIFW